MFEYFLRKFLCAPVLSKMGKEKRKKEKKKDKKKRSKNRSPSPPAKKPRLRSRSPSSSSSSSSGEDVPGGRAYSIKEIEVIVNEYMEHIQTLEDTGNKSIPNVKRRTIIWREIGKKVSRVHNKLRSGASCQEKLKKLRSALKLEG